MTKKEIIDELEKQIKEIENIKAKPKVIYLSTNLIEILQKESQKVFHGIPIQKQNFFMGIPIVEIKFTENKIIVF